MKYAFVFITLGATCLYYACTLETWPLRLCALWCGLAFSGVGGAYAGVGARLFGKRSSGHLCPMSALVFGPYHGLNIFGLWWFRRREGESPFNQITERVVLGCRLNSKDEAAFEALGVVAVLDVCGEFGEVGFIRQQIGAQLEYLSLPTLDTQAPSQEDLEAGVRWLERETRRGPVYVHCALGHGRSAIFVAAYLLRSGRTQSVEEALALIALQRPHIGLSHVQTSCLETWKSTAKNTGQIEGTEAAR